MAAVCVNCGDPTDGTTPCPCDDPTCVMGVCSTCAASIRRNMLRQARSAELSP